MEFYYEKKGGKFVINNFIRDSLKKKFNFKWAKLENTGHQRIQKLRLINGFEKHKFESKEIQKVRSFVNSPLDIKLFNILTLKDLNFKENFNCCNSDNDNFENFKRSNYFITTSAINLLNNKDYIIKGDNLENNDKEILQVI